MQAVLAEHVIACRHCLAMALFRAETLAQVGCEEYKHFLASFHAICHARGFSSSLSDAEQTGIRLMPELGCPT